MEKKQQATKKQQNGIFRIRKWRRTSTNSGAIVEASYYDETSGDGGKWKNVSFYVPFASNYAGKEEERPAAVCARSTKNPESLVISVNVFDDYLPKLTEDAKKSKDEDEEPF